MVLGATPEWSRTSSAFGIALRGGVAEATPAQQTSARRLHFNVAAAPTPGGAMLAASLRF